MVASRYSHVPSAASPLNLCEFPEDLHEHVLQQVLAFDQAAGKPARQVIDPAGMQPVELLERPCLAAPAAIDEVGVSRFHRDLPA